MLTTSKFTSFFKIVIFCILFLFCSTPAVSASTPEAKIGSKNYSTLQSAVNSARAGQTITLCSTVKTKKSVQLKKKNITIDFAGKKYTYTATGVAFRIDGGSVTFKNMKITSSSGAATIEKDSKVTFVNGEIKGYILNRGTAVCKDGSYAGAGHLNKMAAPAFYNIGTLKICQGYYSGSGRMILWNSGKCTIEGGTFSVIRSFAISNREKAVLTIQNGIFRSSELKKHQALLKNLDGSVTIQAGFFKGPICNATSGRKRLIIYGGTFRARSGDVVIDNKRGNCVINGGAFATTMANTAENERDGKMTITGGSFFTKYDDLRFGVCNEGVLYVTGGTFRGNERTNFTIGCWNKSKWFVLNSNVIGTVDQY